MAETKYPHKILIIEDEEPMLQALTDNLKAAGFEHILQARDGEEGLASALTDKPDLILLGYDQQSIAEELTKINVPFTILLPHKPELYKSSINNLTT